MSKSLGNQIGITDEPAEMFGRVMSISDALMERYADLLLADDATWAAEAPIHPLERKKMLADKLVARFHGPEAAALARRHFEERFQRRADYAPTPITLRTGESEMWICHLLKDAGLAASTSAARRLVGEFRFRKGVNRLVSVGRRRLAEITLEPAEGG
jgi:tyrosyl-tRNA synthetase